MLRSFIARGLRASAKKIVAQLGTARGARRRIRTQTERSLLRFNKNQRSDFRRVPVAHYYAATTPTYKLRATLRRKKNKFKELTEVELLTEEPFVLYNKNNNKADNDKFNSAQQKLSDLFSYLKNRYIYPLSWGARFYIDKQNDTINACNYLDRIPEVRENSNIINKEFPEMLGRTFPQQVSYDSFEPVFLYSIPQDKWDMFLSELADQSIVSSLELSTHRHLWEVYNKLHYYDSETKKLIAQLVSSYHFLSAFVGFKTHANRMKSQLCFLDIVNQVKKGHSPLPLLQSSRPYFTKNFLKKNRHSPCFYQLTSVGDRILEYAKHKNSTIDSNTLLEFINAIPCSVKHPVEYRQMIGALLGVGWNIDSKIQLNLFYNSRYNPLQHLEVINTVGASVSTEINDYIGALHNDLFFPEFLRRWHSSEQWVDKRNLKGWHGLTRTSTADYLTKKLSISQLLFLVKRWHRNVNVIEAEKPEPIVSQSWYPLFQEQKISNVHFRVLTSKNELKEEGAKMLNCVAGYADVCLNGRTHIVSAVSGTDEEDSSTIELKLSRNNQIVIVQHMGKNNSVPSTKMEKAAELLIKKINSGRVEINKKTGNVAPHLKEDHVMFDFYPYRLNDAKAQEKIFHLYKKHKTLGAPLKSEKKYREMIDKPELASVVNP